MDIGKDLVLEMYQKMQRIRHFEQKIKDLITTGEIPGFLHVSIGEEATAVGVCAALRPTDRTTSTHRGHGHLIAKGGDVARMMAEIYGKRTGYCKGKGGSMHIVDFSLGILGANGIVGGGIPIATGSALGGVDHQAATTSPPGFLRRWRLQRRGPSTNRSIWPRFGSCRSILRCENNGFGEFTPTAAVTAVKDIAVRAKSYYIPGYVVDGNDVL